MANSLEFKITAEDQASRTVETVQRKIQNFGHDIAKMALGFAGPAAIVTQIFSKISDSMDEANKKSEEAKTYNIEGAYQELKLREEITKKVIEAYQVILAQKKLEDEKKAEAEKTDLAKREAAKIEVVKMNPALAYMPYGQLIANVLSKIPKYQTEILKNEEKLTAELNAQVNTREASRADWAALAQSIKEYDSILSVTERKRRDELSYVERIKKAQSELVDLQVKSQQIQSVVTGASSLAEAGGGFAGEQRSLAAAQDRMIQEQQRVAEIQQKLAEENIAIAQTLKASADSLNITVTNFSKVVTEMPSATSSMDLNVGGSTFDINDKY